MVKKKLVKFGVENCYLSSNEAEEIYEVCIEALNLSIKEVENYIFNNKQFFEVGVKMIDSWKLSLDEKDYKELPDEIIRNWK